jgi:hypothetical protein
MRLEGLGKLKKKKKFTSLGHEPAIFRIIAQFLNHGATREADYLPLSATKVKNVGAVPQLPYTPSWHGA